MSFPPFSGRGASRATRRLRDAPLDDRETAYHGSWSGDAVLLGLVVSVLLINGVIIWNQLGPSQEHVRRALFFGVLLVCVFWVAIVYTFKLSVSVRVGPHGLAIARGPWRTELPWREVTRLVERIQTHRQQRYRWVVALTRDGRRLQVREDMVLDYGRFRYEVYERYRLWQDHGGTWGTAGGGPFMAREVVSSRVTWWVVLFALFLLPGLYFTILLPETGLLGPALLVLGIGCGAMAVRVVLGRQAYTVDARSLKAAGPLRSVDLAWRDVARVERVRHPFSGVLEVAIKVGRLALALAARTDPRVESFAWHPRVPEYLALRGTGVQVRIALHRVARPDELLAWVEFYERVGLRSADQPRRAAPGATGRPAREELLADLAVPGGPVDPWALPSPTTADAGGGQPGGREVRAGGMSFVLDRAPGQTGRPLGAAEAGMPDDGSAQGGLADWEQHAAGWSGSGGGGSALAGSLDQLWSESQADMAFVAPEDDAEEAGTAPDGYADVGGFDPHGAGAGHATGAPRTSHAPVRDEWAALPQEPADEIEGDADDAPTSSMRRAADAPAPWQANPEWSPPPLPRYGPSREQPPERPSAGSFAEDEFLR